MITQQPRFFPSCAIEKAASRITLKHILGKVVEAVVVDHEVVGLVGFECFGNLQRVFLKATRQTALRQTGVGVLRRSQ